jgi:hypothetical protein
MSYCPLYEPMFIATQFNMLLWKNITISFPQSAGSVYTLAVAHTDQCRTT